MKVARFCGFLLVWFIVWVAVSGVMAKVLFPPGKGNEIGAFNLDWRNLSGIILGFIVGVQSLRQGWPWMAWTTLVITLAVWWVGWQIVKIRSYHSESLRVQYVLDTTLREKRPQHISQGKWNIGVNGTITASCNVFFSPEHASYQSLKAFGEALDDKLQKEVDEFIFEWIWNQFAQTGPAGKQYFDRFWPVLQEDFHNLHERKELVFKLQLTRPDGQTSTSPEAILRFP